MIFETIKKLFINNKEVSVYDPKKAYKRYVKTKNGYVEEGISIGIDHPCYKKVEEAIEEYNKNKD